MQLAAPNAAERIRVYKNANRTEPVTLPASWSLGTEPDVLHVEGVLVSQSVRDVRLRLKFTPNSDAACTDVVKLTVVRVDLDAANLLDEDE